ncbi:hypothetical protein O3P69_010359 [Scylla paramamosain]|uniref:WAP domain-containing protein n=1 Tax=Scylla paramamosain TaxID=85552 RepID=A0AAW0TTI3_SCYPA
MRFMASGALLLLLLCLVAESSSSNARKKCPPIDPLIRCFHYYNNCNLNDPSSCRRGEKCCPGACGTQCVSRSRNH